MREFVRYSPGIEAPDPNFDSALHTVLEDLRQQVTASPKFDGGVAVRNAHAKGYGLARGEVEILADIPPEYAQGIYSKPGRHEAMVRFSNGQPHINSDKLLGVIDLANSPSFEDKAVLKFFETSGRNLLAAEAAAGGVRHHVALSIVGIDRSDNGYFRAKLAQEKLIKDSGTPYTIIRSTQFLEFLRGIVASGADGNIVRISPGLFQPIAADDVGAIVADVALAAPRNGIVEIAGPERAPFNEFVARYLKAIGDPRKVVSDPEGRYFGGRVEERSLVPLGEARLGRIDFDEWLRRSQAAA